MPFADQVPINSPHSTMHGGKWVVLIARSTGSALRAVCPFQPLHHAGWPARSRLRRQRDGFFVAFASGHHGPGHPCGFVGRRKGGDLGGPPRQYRGEPRPMLGAIDLGIANDTKRACREQATQITVTLLADAAEPVLASTRMLLRHQSNPGREVSP